MPQFSSLQFDNNGLSTIAISLMENYILFYKINKHSKHYLRWTCQNWQTRITTLKNNLFLIREI